jgi:hypothetical protein
LRINPLVFRQAGERAGKVVKTRDEYNDLVRERKKAIEVSAFSLVREFIRLAALDDRRAFKSAGPVIIKRSINIDKRIDRD